jgi:peptide methionine sulfoxide reductase msrA/msrB
MSYLNLSVNRLLKLVIFLLAGLSMPALATDAKVPSGAMMMMQSRTQKAILAGGCFWGMEEVYRKIPGVVKTQVGYAGGQSENPSYEQVSSGSTGYAESIEVEFDPTKITYEEILKIFFRMHDPTSLNRQGNDVGTQYRSEIFYQNDIQKQIAEKVIKLVDQSKKWSKPVVTKLETAPKFYPAEDYHQKYLVKNPNGYNDHYLRSFTF